MIVLDVNVVLAAHRDDHPQHDIARPWLERLVETHEQFGVPLGVWASFFRLATDHRVFVIPTPIDDAFAYVKGVRSQATHVACEPGPRHLDLVRSVCVEASASGNLVPDAVIAAVALEHGAKVASFDRDFARFEAIEWVRPSIT